MAPPHDELAQLHKEWREIVLKDLSELKVLVQELSAQIVDVKMTFAQQTELSELRSRVSLLENFKAKMIGITIGANALFMILFEVITRFAR